MSTLVKVNGESIDVAAALRLSALHDGTFVRDTIKNALIRQYAEKQNIRNTDQELQLAADELRYSRGLEAVDAVHQWMRESNQTLLSIQEGIDMMLLNNKVRNAIPDSEIQAYFAEHQLELESVDLYSIRVDSEDKAAELRSQINEEGAPFHDLAVQHSQDEASRHLGGYVGRLRRSDMTGAVEAAVFKAGAGAVIGPIKTDKGWNLFKVAAIHKPTLDEAKDTIRIQLMEQLVTKLTADAAIEHSIFDGTATQSA